MAESANAPIGPPNSDRAEMNEVISFLNAWCDEDEAVALATLNTGVRAGMKRGKPVPRWLPEPDSGGIWDETGIRRVAHTWQQERAHIVRHDPARALRDVAVVRQVINDYRMSDGAIIRADDYDPDHPGWIAIHAGRDAFKSVLRAYATAAGWKPSA